MRFFFIFLLIALIVLVSFLGFYELSSLLSKNNLLINYALHSVLVGIILSQNPKRLISDSLTQHLGGTLRAVLGVLIGQRLMMEGFTALMAPLPWWQLWVEEYNSLFQRLSPAELWSNILVLGPIREEVFFRWMYGALARKNQASQPYLMIFFSTFTFTLIHPPVAWLNALIWGWALMHFYLKTQSLVFVVVLHSFINAIAYVFPLSSLIQSDTTFLSILLNVLCLAIGFLFVAFSLDNSYNALNSVKNKNLF